MKKLGFEFWNQQALTPDNQADFFNFIKSYNQSENHACVSNSIEVLKLEEFFFNLTESVTEKTMDFKEVLLKRHSARNFEARPLSLNVLENLLQTAIGPTFDLRHYPSAGGFYSVQFYCIINSVGDLPRGIYFYSLKNKSLKKIHPFDDFYHQYKLLGFSAGDSPAVTVVLTSIFSDVIHKYGERGWRFIDLEVGAAIQNIHLTSTALNLKSYICGAGYDYEILTALKSHASYEVYLSAIHIGQ